MGLFGSRKKSLDIDELPAVPPRFAPEEVHTAYKEALAKDALPSTQLPPEPKNLWPAPVQDSLAPITSKKETSLSLKQSFVPSSLDDAVNDEPVFKSRPVASDPLTTVADMPVSQKPVQAVQEQKPASIPATSVQEEIANPSASLAPEGEIPDAPSPDPEPNPESDSINFSQAPVSFPPPQQSLTQSAFDTALEEKVSDFNDGASASPSTPSSTSVSPSAPIVDAPSPRSTYVASSSTPITNYIPKPLPDFPEDDVSNQQAFDDLSPIAPREGFDEDELPEIGVPVDEYTSNMAAKPSSNFNSRASSSSPSTLVPFDLEPPVKPTDLPSSLPEDNPEDLIAPELAPLDTTTKMYTQSDKSDDSFAKQTPSSPTQFSHSQTVSPVEERVILKHAVGTDVFVEKFVYEDALLNVSVVQKDLQNAGSHLDKVMRDEIAVTKKIDDWNATLNIIQEKLMTIDIRLFEKGDV